MKKYQIYARISVTDNYRDFHVETGLIYSIFIVESINVHRIVRAVVILFAYKSFIYNLCWEVGLIL